MGSNLRRDRIAKLIVKLSVHSTRRDPRLSSRWGGGVVVVVGGGSMLVVKSLVGRLLLTFPTWQDGRGRKGRDPPPTIPPPPPLLPSGC